MTVVLHCPGLLQAGPWVHKTFHRSPVPADFHHQGFSAGSLRVYRCHCLLDDRNHCRDNPPMPANSVSLGRIGFWGEVHQQRRFLVCVRCDQHGYRHRYLLATDIPGASTTPSLAGEDWAPVHLRDWRIVFDAAFSNGWTVLTSCSVCATSIIRTVAVTGTTDRSMDKSRTLLAKRPGAGKGPS